MASFTNQTKEWIGTRTIPTVFLTGEVLLPAFLTEAVEQTTLSLLGVDPTKVHLYAHGTSVTGLEAGTVAPDTDQIVSIDADGRPAKQISFELSIDAADEDSIYYATTLSPVWWLEQGKIKVFPTAGVTTWSMVKVGGQSVTTANELAGTVTGNFPTRYISLLPLYCAERILSYWQTDMRNDIPALSDTTADPLSRAEYEALGVDKGWEIVRYLIETEEDVELANAKIAQLGQEQQQWYKDYEWIVQQLQAVKAEYMRRLGAA